MMSKAKAYAKRHKTGTTFDTLPDLPLPNSHLGHDATGDENSRLGHDATGDERRIKSQQIHSFLDGDGDGYLNYREFNQLMVLTAPSDDMVLSYADYLELCSVCGVNDPKRGFTADELYRSYVPGVNQAVINNPQELHDDHSKVFGGVSWQNLPRHPERLSQGRSATGRVGKMLLRKASSCCSVPPKIEEMRQKRAGKVLGRGMERWKAKKSAVTIQSHLRRHLANRKGRDRKYESEMNKARVERTAAPPPSNQEYKIAQKTNDVIQRGCDLISLAMKEEYKHKNYAAALSCFSDAVACFEQGLVVEPAGSKRYMNLQSQVQMYKKKIEQLQRRCV